jgi:hypothetical protein
MSLRFLAACIIRWNGIAPHAMLELAPRSQLWSSCVFVPFPSAPDCPKRLPPFLFELIGLRSCLLRCTSASVPFFHRGWPGPSSSSAFWGSPRRHCLASACHVPAQGLPAPRQRRRIELARTCCLLEGARRRGPRAPRERTAVLKVGGPLRSPSWVVRAEGGPRDPMGTAGSYRRTGPA